MVDWRLVGVSAVWLAGAAALLAGLSYGYWEARTAGRPLRAWLGGRGWWRRLYPAALGLVCAGLGLSANAGWEQAAWAALAVFSVWDLVANWRRG